MSAIFRRDPPQFQHMLPSDECAGPPVSTVGPHCSTDANESASPSSAALTPPQDRFNETQWG